jgi:CRP-like cAMP-binding protein
MDTTHACSNCKAAKHAGLHLIKDEHRVCLNNSNSTHHYKKGDVIFTQGQHLTHVLCLRSGLVRLDAVGDNGHEMTFGLIKTGDLLGLGSVLAKKTSTVTATAIEETYACSFTTEYISKMVSETPELAIHYLSIMMNDLRETQQRLLNGVDKDVRARVAESLIYLKANYPDHNFTRKEIAEWAGTTTESVIRTLGHLEEDGIINQSGRKILVTDSSRLNQLAHLVF